MTQVDIEEYINKEKELQQEHYNWQQHVSLAYDSFEDVPEIKKRYYHFNYWRSLSPIERRKVWV